ncbi:MAG: four-carbon acid sugar kinase family protein [Rubrivivax sp.]|nr:four-carbon acid sugar kinase family protein [Rubrivivax sp.]
MPDPPRLAWFGDDFTGSSDTLATLAEAGWRAVLFLAPPTAAQRERVGPLDALGVAGTARALAPDAMREQIAPVADAFAALRPAVTHYKCCSTYDSAPGTGNLAVGLRALRRPLHAPVALVLGGQPSLGRLCLAGTLFASAGAGGPLHRIDRHPTMSVHPVTPMLEADLRRHLQALGIDRVELLDVRRLDDDDDAALDAAFAARIASGPEALLVDVARSAHLARIGHWLVAQAAQQPQLVLGASSVAQALVAAHGRGCLPTQAAVPAASGPVFLLVGSLSPVSAAQCDVASAAYELQPIDPVALAASQDAFEARVGTCATALRAGRSVLARTAPAATGGLPPLQVAELCGRLLAAVLARVPAVRRAGVAGGDTSGWAVQALQPWALRWAGTLAAGVPLLRLHAGEARIEGLELMLKGGQMGPPDVFLRLRDGTA